MISTILLVIGVAVIAGLAYLGFKSGYLSSELEQEKTASDANRKAANSANQTILKLDALERAKEKAEEEQAYEHENDVTRTRIGFYPRLHPDSDKDNLN